MATDLHDLINIDLLALFKSKLDLIFANKVDKETGKGLSSNDYTSEEKAKLANVESGAQANTLEGIQVAGTTISPVNKIANIPAATTSAAGAMSAADKTKLDGVAAGAQVNVLEGVNVNGTAQTITNKYINLSIKDIAWFDAAVTGTTYKTLSSGSGLTAATLQEAITTGKLPVIKLNFDANDYLFLILTEQINGTNGDTTYNFSCSDSVGACSAAATIRNESLSWGQLKLVSYVDFDEVHYYDFTVTYSGDTPTITTSPKTPSTTLANIVTDIRDGKMPCARVSFSGDCDFEDGGPYYLRLSIGGNSYLPRFTGWDINTDDVAITQMWLYYEQSAWHFGFSELVSDSDLSDALDNKVDKVSGKGLSTEDYTTAEKTKLGGIATGAQVNVIETVKVNNVERPVTSKAVNISVPTKTSDITNDSGFITISDVPEGAAASNTTPIMDGTATVGTETAFARGDHVHPSDSTKVDKIAGKGLSTEDYTSSEKTKLSGIAAGAQVNVVTDASTSGSGAAQTMTVSKGENSYTTYTKAALDSSLGAKADANSVYTKTEIDQKLSGAMNYKGTKATTSALPVSGNSQGDVWHVTADGSEWAWNGSSWEELGTVIDLSGYVEESDIGLASTTDIDDLFT